MGVSWVLARAAPDAVRGGVPERGSASQRSLRSAPFTCGDPTYGVALRGAASHGVRPEPPFGGAVGTLFAGLPWSSATLPANLFGQSTPRPLPGVAPIAPALSESGPGWFHSLTPTAPSSSAIAFADPHVLPRRRRPRGSTRGAASNATETTPNRAATCRFGRAGVRSPGGVWHAASHFRSTPRRQPTDRTLCGLACRQRSNP